MKKIIPVLLITAIILSCSEQKEKQISVSSNITMLSSPAADSCAEPYLYTDSQGIVYLSWVEKIGNKSSLKFSSFKNEKWDSAATIRSGNNWFVNWADYPVIATDGSRFFAHYLEKSGAGKYAYDIKIIAWGDMWSDSLLLNEDHKEAEHGFVSIVPYDGKFFITWLDGRKTAGEEEHTSHEGHHGQMTLRAAFIDKNGKKINEWELDERICDCCQTTAAITNDGPVVVYRDRSDDEIRDMSIVRFINDSWTKPQTIHADNWQIKACPVNGPRVDAINNHLAIAWFSMRDKQGKVKIVFSHDGGATFGKAIQINEENTIGRVDVVMLDSSTAFVSWMEDGSIKAVKIRDDGTKGSSMMIASSTDKRSSGFPQMTRSGNKLFFAWTDDKAKTIRVATTDL